jgi:prepilin-type N-terminal cleavage/methylation domain-containing protein
MRPIDDEKGLGRMFLNSMRKRHSGEGGFTLVELLVVIVILGVLAGIVVFSVSGISNKSTKAACNSDVSTVQTAEEAYYAQNNAYTTIANLVSTNLLRAAPSNSGYTISADSTTGAVTATPACSTL